MPKIKNGVIWLALWLLLSSCAFLPPVKPPADSEPALCLPQFPDRNGWYGGDGAYSIALDDRRTLWLFGDTFVSPDDGRKDRSGMDLVWGTTLAVSTCSENAAFDIRYYLKKKNGRFVSSFGDGDWLWPQDPFLADNTLYIPLLAIETVPDAPPPFNFRVAGHRIARIRDFRADDPHDWPVEYLDWSGVLPRDIEALATTSVVHKDHVYFYPLVKFEKSGQSLPGNILARIPIRCLDDPAGHIEYRTAQGWQKKLTSETAQIQFSAGVSELSVRYHAGERQWLAVYLSPANRGDRLLYQTAPRPEGPWSPPAPLIERINEVNPASPLYSPHTFCYAGKEHRQFSQNKSLVVTYVCNSAETPDTPASFLRTRLFLYRPVVKVLPR